MTEGTLSAKNQTVIPREARKALRLKPGDKVLVLVRSGGIVLLRKPKSYHAAIRGLARGLRKPKSYHAAIRGLARGTYPKTYLQRERKSWD